LKHSCDKGNQATNNLRGFPAPSTTPMRPHANRPTGPFGGLEKSPSMPPRPHGPRLFLGPYRGIPPCGASNSCGPEARRKPCKIRGPTPASPRTGRPGGWTEPPAMGKEGRQASPVQRWAAFPGSAPNPPGTGNRMKASPNPEKAWGPHPETVTAYAPRSGGQQFGRTPPRQGNPPMAGRPTPRQQLGACM